MSDDAIKVDKGRYCEVVIELPLDLTGEEIRSEIRERIDPLSPKIADWDVAFTTDGSNGELLLTLTSAQTAAITQVTGYTDFVRLVGGEFISVLEEPIPVIFKKVVTTSTL